jgi:hypothetical protein
MRYFRNPFIISYTLGAKLPAPQAPDANVLKANAANLRNSKPPASKGGCC